MAPNRRTNDRNVGNNSSSDTPLETLVANAVNAAISRILPNLMTQTAQTVVQQIQQANLGGNNNGPPPGGNNTGPPPGGNNSGPPPGGNNTGPPPGGNATPPVAEIHVWLERFMKQRPRSFSDAATPMDARNWIAHVEKIFEVLGVGDVFKTRLASYKLEDDALVWWEGVKLAHGGEGYAATLPWADFRTIFFRKYFSEVERNEYAREYASIEQRDDEPWQEFMARFCRLASFLGEAAGSPVVQAEKLKWAVHERTRRWIVTQKFNNINEVADAVKTLDMENKKRLAKAEESRKRNREGNHTAPSGQSSNEKHNTGDRKAKFNKNNNRQGNQWKQKQQNPKPAENQGQEQAPVCTTCGKRHFGICRRASGACFRCGKIGHLLKDCPYPDNKGKAGSNAKQPTNGGRVFALNAKDAANTPGQQGHPGGE